MSHDLSNSVSLGYLLFEAIENDDEAMTQHILKNNPDMEVVKTFQGRVMRPLEYAIMNNKETLAIMLIHGKAPLTDNAFYDEQDFRTTHGHPFLLSSQMCQLSVAHAILNCLDTEDQQELLQERLFCSVLGEKITELKNLIDLGADVNTSDPEIGNTPLFHACAIGNQDVIDCLVHAGASWDVTNQKGQSPKDFIVSNFPHLKARYNLEDNSVVHLSSRMRKR